MNKNKIDIKTKRLFFGFIRKLRITDKIIPSSLIELCMLFYHSKQRIIFIQNVNDTVSINIAELDSNNSKCCECKIEKLIVKDNKSQKLWNSSTCLVNNFKLPQAILSLDLNTKLDSKRLYDIIFQIGGSGVMSAFILDSSLTYSDAKFMPCYYCSRLPQLGLITHSAVSSCYSAKHGLIAAGGNKHSSILSMFSFDEFKWKKIDKLDRWRKLGLLTMIGVDKLIFCGGVYNKTYVKWADIYDFNQKKWIKMSNMNYKRCRAGMYCDKYFKKRVYVGGGKTSKAHLNTFEYFDIVTNRWIMLPNTNNCHVAPTIWMDNPNNIHIASVYANIFESMDLRENKWEMYKIKHHKYKSVNSVFNKSLQYRFSRLLYYS